MKIPALLDGIDNGIERTYTGWPDRLYIIGTDGRIYYKSAPGPFGFSTKELEASLKQLAWMSTEHHAPNICGDQRPRAGNASVSYEVCFASADC